jgi:hypothetical protein
MHQVGPPSSPHPPILSSPSLLSSLLSSTSLYPPSLPLSLSNDSSTNWLEAAARTVKSDEDFNTCVAGEAVRVAVTFRNPLLVRDVAGGGA